MTRAALFLAVGLLTAAGVGAEIVEQPASATTTIQRRVTVCTASECPHILNDCNIAGRNHGVTIYKCKFMYSWNYQCPYYYCELHGANGSTIHCAMH